MEGTIKIVMLFKWNRKLEAGDTQWIGEKQKHLASHKTVNLSQNTHTHKCQYALSETYFH